MDFKINDYVTCSSFIGQNGNHGEMIKLTTGSGFSRGPPFSYEAKIRLRKKQTDEPVIGSV
jgi:hypothetical protein